MNINFLDYMIDRNRQTLKSLGRAEILKKPERDYLMEIQRKVFYATKMIENKNTQSKVREFNISCDRLIFKRKVSKR